MAEIVEHNLGGSQFVSRIDGTAEREFLLTGILYSSEFFGEAIPAIMHPPVVQCGTTFSIDLESPVYANKLELLVSDGSAIRNITINSLAQIQPSVIVSSSSVSFHRAMIQEAITQAIEEGKDSVYLMPGVYVIDSTPHPQGGNVGLILPDNIRLMGNPGTTILRRADNMPASHTMVINENIAYDSVGNIGNENIFIQDIILDGNAANNPLSAAQAQFGLQIYTSNNVHVERVYVKNVHGTAAGGSGESFCMSFNSCSDVRVSKCTAEGNSLSSTGFSFNACMNVSLHQCVSFNHDTIGAGGYTHWRCENIAYHECYAWNNKYAGFNNELSNGVSYVSCAAGGKVPHEPTFPGGLWEGSYPYDAEALVGNIDHGFVIGGAVGLTTFTNCMAAYNGLNGIQSTDHEDVQVFGGSYHDNAGYGIALQEAGKDVKIFGAQCYNNTTHEMWIGDSQFIDDVSPFAVLVTGKPASGFTPLDVDANGVVAPRAKTIFTITQNGWHRIAYLDDFYAGKLHLKSDQVDNRYTDIVFHASQSAFVAIGMINVLQNLAFNANHIQSIRTGYDSVDEKAYLDIQFSNITATLTVTIDTEGITLLGSPTFNPGGTKVDGAIFDSQTYGTGAVGFVLSSAQYSYDYLLRATKLWFEGIAAFNKTVRIDGTAPKLILRHSGAGTDAKVIELATANGSMTVQSLTDAETGTVKAVFTITHSSGRVTFHEDIQVTQAIRAVAGINSFDDYRFLNKAQSAWLDVIERDESGSEAVARVRQVAAIYDSGGNQIVSTRNTGWTAMTGTADEATAFDTASLTLENLAQRVKALQDALTTHGLIGT